MLVFEMRFIRKAVLTWNSARKKKQCYNMKNMCQLITQL